MKRSTWQHLRFSFSFYLAPVFFFAVCQYPFPDIKLLIISFFAIHFLLYPAIHGYNSYFDKDTESIGGIQKPLPVSRELYFVSLLFDLAAIGLGFLISWQFALMLFVFGLVSKSYSHPWIRLKKYGITSLVIVSVFQGGFAYIMAYMALHDLQFKQLLNEKNIIYPAVLSTIMMMGFYPMTQIYQHKADKQHGDNTISLMLGLNGTFIFSAAFFLVANLGFYLYFLKFYHSVIFFSLFQVFLSPLFAFFILWYFAFQVDPAEANFRNSMLLNKISSACLLAYFIFLAYFQNRF